MKTPSEPGHQIDGVASAASARHGPRPLAVHIAQAEWAWRTGDPGKLTDFYRGIKAYREHPYRRQSTSRPAVWRHAGSRLLDYGPKDGWPLLVIPSLINRGYILDLTPGSSLLQWLSARGMRPLLLDWGAGLAEDRRFRLSEIVLDHLVPALRWIGDSSGRRPLVLGYCMGGTLATALACLSANELAGLALLATPWQFEPGAPLLDRRPAYWQALSSSTGLVGSAPVDLLQSIFAQIDPLTVPKKFARFSHLAQSSSAATRFVAIEDWLNDGVPLSAEIASECFIDWYERNAPARGNWSIGNQVVRPERLDLPVCLVVADRDRIVPERSSLALAAILKACTLIRPRSGHIGMIVGDSAQTTLWKPLLGWFQRIAAMQKSSL